MWLKLSDDFPDRCAAVELSDAAFRTHVEALCWCMRRENGGRLSARDVRRLAESMLSDGAVEELVAHGFWADTGTGYEVVMGMEHQPEPDVIQARRDLNAERQRRHRRSKASLSVSHRDAARDTARDETRDPGRDGSGRVPDPTSTTQLLEAQSAPPRNLHAYDLPDTRFSLLRLDGDASEWLRRHGVPAQRTPRLRGYTVRAERLSDVLAMAASEDIRTRLHQGPPKEAML